MDIQGGTTQEGIHAGVMTGTVFFTLRAFAGINLDGPILEVNPRLPTHWRAIRFSLSFKGCRYTLMITTADVKVKVDGNSEKNICVYGKDITLQPAQWHRASLPTNQEG
jgi:trehalose/maltose hydrolase-like predicted phosphorylase